MLIKSGSPHQSDFYSPAYLWDGNKQLPGMLSLTPKNLIFKFDNFQKSYLNLQIPLDEIEKAEPFLIYDIARNGLKIEGKKGQTDLFILEDPVGFRKVLMNQITQNIE